MAENGLLDEIFVALGFKVDEKKVKDFKSSLDVTIGSLKRVVVATTGAVVAIDRMANALLRANQAYVSFNQQTGISIGAMNNIIGAGMLSNYNLTADAMMSSVQALQSNLSAIKYGQGNIAPFQMLGISPVGKDAIQVIEELRGAIQGISDMDAVNLIQQMGLSPDMISLLRLSSTEMQRLNAAAQQFMLTDAQRQSLNQFALELRLVHMEMSYLKDKAIIAMAPHLIKLLNNFAKILELLFEYRKVLMWLGVGGVGAIMAMNRSVRILGITINATFGKWLAALTAIYLILEDIAVWNAGGQSLIGDLYEWSQRGHKRDKDAPRTDDLYKNVYGKDRNLWTKYSDWIQSGGPIGTLFSGGALSNDFYGNMLKMQQGNSGAGSVHANQNLTQNNYVTVGGQNAPQQAAQQVTDLMFTFMQADGTR